MEKVLRRGRSSVRVLFKMQTLNSYRHQLCLNSSKHFHGDRKRITSPGIVFIRTNLTNFYALESLCITVPSCIPKYAVSAIPTKRPVSTSPGMPCSADSTSRQLFSEFLSQYLVILCAMRFRNVIHILYQSMIIPPLSVTTGPAFALAILTLEE